MASSTFSCLAGAATAPISIEKMGWFDTHMVASAAALELLRDITKMALSVISIPIGLQMFGAIDCHFKKGKAGETCTYSLGTLGLL
jgi:hypothetical protein